MTLPNPTEVKELFDFLCQKTDYYNVQNGLPEGCSRRHYLYVAQNAKLIASKTAYLKAEKAYILGLFHDFGEYLEQENHSDFHGTAGYDEMLSRGYDEVAKVCLSHSFWDDIKPENYSSYDKKSILRAADLIKENPLDDYDHLIQLSDLLVVGDKLATIEERMNYIAEKYHIAQDIIEHKKQKANRLKQYFDKLCGEDVYKIIGLKNA